MELHQHECPACHRIYDCECHSEPIEDFEVYCQKCYAIVEADLEG